MMIMTILRRYYMFDLLELQKRSTAKRYEKNQLIIKEGDKSYSMYIVLAGLVRVVKNYNEFDQMSVANLGPGEFFGEMSLFLLKERTATVVTVEETVVLEINQTNVFDMMSENPQMPYSIIKTLCSRIDDLNERVRMVKNVPMT